MTISARKKSYSARVDSVVDSVATYGCQISLRKMKSTYSAKSASISISMSEKQRKSTRKASISLRLRRYQATNR